jgi:hypothetical protein
MRSTVLRGAQERLPSILVTALGLLPLAFGSGQPGSEIEGSMATITVGGLVTSTLLNLVILPTDRFPSILEGPLLYSLRHIGRRRCRAWANGAMRIAADNSASLTNLRAGLTASGRCDRGVPIRGTGSPVMGGVLRPFARRAI